MQITRAATFLFVSFVSLKTSHDRRKRSTERSPVLRGKSIAEEISLARARKKNRFARAVPIPAPRPVRAFVPTRATHLRTGRPCRTSRSMMMKPNTEAKRNDQKRNVPL